MTEIIKIQDGVRIKATLDMNIPEIRIYPLGIHPDDEALAIMYVRTVFNEARYRQAQANRERREQC